MKNNEKTQRNENGAKRNGSGRPVRGFDSRWDEYSLSIRVTNFAMKKVLSLTASLCCVIALTGCEVTVSHYETSTQNFDAVASNNQGGEIQGTFPLLEVENSMGDVRVIGKESGPITWSWKLTASAAKQEVAEDMAKRAVCVAGPEQEKLRIVVSLPDTKGKARYESHLEIRVPKSMSVNAENQYGRIEISDISENVEANNQSGSIEISNVGRKVRAQNSYATIKLKNVGPATLKNQSGAIEVTEVHGALNAETTYAALTADDVNGGARLRNQSGRVRLANCTGDADIATSYAALDVSGTKGNATLANQSGSIKAEGVTGLVKANTSYAALTIASGGPSIVCQNQSGSISVDATSLSVTNIEARTTYAGLELRLPRDLKPAVQARTTYADIESDFPVLMKPNGQDAFADVPAGAPRVTLRNESGKIRVAKN